MGEIVEQGRVDEGLLGEEDILQAGGRGEEHGGGDEVGVAYGLKIVSLHYAVAVTHAYISTILHCCSWIQRFAHDPPLVVLETRHKNCSKCGH